MKKFKLQFPIEIKQENNEVLIIKELQIESLLRAKHMRFIPTNVYEDGITPPHLFIPLIASLCNVSKEVIEETEMNDFIELVEIISDLLSRGEQSPQTGNK